MGGVLRGQKSRFQLFGDTMNTTSRMESNGEAGRMHVSLETMQELTTRGKSSWVSPRDKRIVARGKGEIQTYSKVGIN
jgi:class 3 adenylate cyclase